MPAAPRSQSTSCTTQSHFGAQNPACAPETPIVEAIRDALDTLTPTEWRNVRATVRAAELGLLEVLP